MKRSVLPILAAGILFFSACTNDNSSTVGTYDEEQSSSSHSGSEGHEPAKEGSSHTESKKEENVQSAEDTSHINISVGKDSAGFENKQGKGVSIDSNGIKGTSKKAKVDVKTNGQ